MRREFFEFFEKEEREREREREREMGGGGERNLIFSFLQKKTCFLSLMFCFRLVSRPLSPSRSQRKVSLSV